MNLLCVQFLLLWNIYLVAAEKPKAVFASLNAKWSSTSLLAETSEFFAKESDQAFFDFIKTVNREIKTVDWDNLSEEKKYEFAIKQSSKLLSPSSIDLLKFSLALRLYSPAVQFFQQIGSEYEDITCDTFFVYRDEKGCTADDLEKALSSKDIGKDETLLSADHIVPSSKSAEKTVVLYGELGTTTFASIYSALSSLAKDGKIRLAIRHFSKKTSSSPVSLSGYGVELAIKNTEYKAVDDSNDKKNEIVEDEENLHGFNIKKLKNLHSDMAAQIETFRIHLKETEELAPLKKWELQDLSFQAAQKIMDADPQNGLSVLTDISQNFPLHARNLARISVNDALKKEISLNRKSLEEMGIDAGENSLYINGINMDIDSLDLFQLAELLKQEDKLATGFHKLGINREYLSVLVGMDLSDEKTSYAIDYREAYPFFLNNLDSDKKYKQWGNSVKLMLQPYYPGMIRPIARNLFTLVFVVDPSDKESRSLMRIGNSFYNHEIAMRIGYVFAVNNDKEVSGKEDLGVAILNLFNFIAIDSSNAEALTMVNGFLENFKSQDPTVADVKSYFTRKFPDADYEDVFGPKSDYDKGRSIGDEFLKKSGLSIAPKVLLNGYPLDDAGLKSDNIEETIMMEVMKITSKLQRFVMEGKLTDRVNVANWLLDQKDVMPRLNKRILSAPSEKKYIDMFNGNKCQVDTLSKFQPLTNADKAFCIVEKMKYVQKSAEDSITPISMWITTDVDSVEGRKFAYNALQTIKSSTKSRIGFLLNPSNEKKLCDPNSISSYIHAAIRLLPNNQAKLLVVKLVKEEFATGLESGSIKFEDVAVSGMNVERFLKEKKQLSCGRLEIEANFVASAILLEKGQRAVVVNGLIIGPLEADEQLEPADFLLLEKLLLSRGAETVASHVNKWEIRKVNGAASDLVLKTSALIGKYAASRKRTWVVVKNDKHSVVTLVADDKDRAAMDVVAVVDPLTTTAQKLGPVLELIRKVTNSDIKMIMNPKEKHSELPIKRFYRYVATSEIQFDQNGNLNPNTVRFDGLPNKQLLTMSLHAPDSWMVEAISAEHDLDNIKLEQVPSDVVAIFSLEHLLLEGQCFDEVSGQPPRGLQFVLGTPSNPSRFDTIVMANLGYFQLKANPGAWQLRLRDGRSQEIYKIASHVGGEKDGEEDVIRVVIDSFSGKSIRVRVSKKDGMEDKNLLSDDEEGVWSSISSFVGDKEKHEKINVFSLASGHLYERFMRIMILSVMKNTKNPVKFWLLKNYLSPQFKKSLPKMAEHYGFEYALVEYKWPRWLHQQKEKHRVMWGYKILFLDVLFPLDVQKIIFVDADQVVRADLMELMKFDLGGAPYGYVPFCESRKEMDGFRFWKQGYWANHLAGRRYHISALYVIDLQKFRQIAAGDRLRGQYQGLSGDPNSLSNLDQDLPNNMIHQVKIKSLPQEWLWCETWCDDSSKKNAKTIDLCNNPLTKEPKLDSAVRIIGEWKKYDDELRAVLSDEVTEDKTEDVHTEL